MHHSISLLSRSTNFLRPVKKLKSTSIAQGIFSSILIAAALSGCGGGSDTSSANSTMPNNEVANEVANTATGTPQSNGATSFHAFAQVKEVSASAEVFAPLTDAEQAEVAALSRQWAVNKLAPKGDEWLKNDVVMPPIDFALFQTIAAAASGTTLDELRQFFPSASSPAVAAALMRGITRTISSGTNTEFTSQFISDITASGQGKTWDKLIFTQLTDADLAAEKNLRLRINDDMYSTTPWPEVTTYDGVFETDNGWRMLVPMLKINGQIRSITDSDMDAVALALPQQRWLVRITPKKGLKAWKADPLNAAIAKAASGITNPAGQATVMGNFILPKLSISPDTIESMTNNFGITLEAQNPIMADLRRLDGHGGTYVDKLLSYSQIVLSESGLELNGHSNFSFIFSPDNRFSSGAVTTAWNNAWYGVPCGATEFRPSYFAVVNAIGAIEVLARISSTEGKNCDDNPRSNGFTVSIFKAANDSTRAN